VSFAAHHCLVLWLVALDTRIGRVAVGVPSEERHLDNTLLGMARVQIWKRAGIFVGRMDEHLIATLCPRLLSALANNHHAIASEASDSITQEHVTSLAAALGVINSAQLMRLDAMLPTLQRTELVATLDTAMQQLTTELGDDWEEVLAEVRRDEEARSKEVRLVSPRLT
jgi:replicative DNA helicase